MLGEEMKLHSDGDILPVFVPLMAIFSITIYLSSYEYLALWDWPNHLIRHAIQCGTHGVSNLGNFYEFKLSVTPNIASDLLHELPMFCVNVLLSQRILVIFYCVALVLSSLVLHWVVWQKISLWPAVSGFVIFNTNFHYGFENYLISMPFSIVFLALWIQFSRQTNILHTITLSVFAFLLYNLHLFGFIFTIFVIYAYDLHRMASHLIRERQFQAVSLQVGRMVLVAAAPTLHFLYTIFFNAPRSIEATFYGGFLDRLLVPASLASPFPLFLGVQTTNETLLGLVLVLAAPLGFCVLQRGVQIDWRIAWVGLAAVGLCLLLPAKTATVYFTQVRFPPLAFIVLVAAIDFQLSVRNQYILAVLMAAGLLMRGSDVDVRWERHSREVSELVTKMGGIATSARLLVARDGHGEQVIGHVNSYAFSVLKTGMYVPTIYHGANTLEVRPEIADRASEQAFPIPVEILLKEEVARCDGDTLVKNPDYLYWRAWREFYTHVLVLRGENGSGKTLDSVSSRVVSGSFFDLYDIAPIEGPSRGCQAPAIAR